MLINKDSPEYQNLNIIRQKQKHYESMGDFVRARKASDKFDFFVLAVASDLVKQIDYEIKELKIG